ncbi:MAG: hypothetical protein DRG20_06710 [Deltaproteobacteria bacterium]|nr:MAG: hypothetical protein DRG20_06710 [Deltaproteobacteria bacterium]
MLPAGHIGFSLVGVITYKKITKTKNPLKLNLYLLIIAALLPDIVDKIIGLIFITKFHTCRLYGHTIWFSFTILFVLYKIYPKWKIYGWIEFGHLLLDNMFFFPQTLFYPLLGIKFYALNRINSSNEYIHKLIFNIFHKYPEILFFEVMGMFFIYVCYKKKDELKNIGINFDLIAKFTSFPKKKLSRYLIFPNR